MQYLFILIFSICLAGFSTSKISSSLSPEAAWVIEEPLGLEEIFSQPFSYLGAGAQSYAFASQDGKYVIKFFRMHHFAPTFKDFFRPKRTAKKHQNRKAFFGAYKLAYLKMREDSGLIFLHLNKTSHLQRKLTVKDKQGKTYQIDLDQTEFVVQEKAELIISYLKKQEPAAQKAALSRLEQLIERRSGKGIFDHDRGVLNNFGFIDGRPVQIDIGRIYEDESPPREGEWERILNNILNTIHAENRT